MSVPMQTAIHLLRELIRIPSVSSLSNRGIVDYATCVLQRVGWQTLRQPYRDLQGVEKYNLLAFPPGQNRTDRLMASALLVLGLAAGFHKLLR